MNRTFTMIILLAAVVNLSAQSAGNPSPQNTRTYTVNGISFKMILVKGGSFTMGCTSEQGGDCDSDEKPSHSVTLSDFWMGETEVTQALWKAVMGNNPSNYKGDYLPVEMVSWDDCQEFIRKLNNLMASKIPSDWKFTLPTEAQWEYAARGGKNKNTYKYSGSNSISDIAWTSENSSYSHNVKGKMANSLGLYDMSGNVREWCQDWYNSSYYDVSPVGDPKGDASGSMRVLRGGSFLTIPKYCRVSYRYRTTPSTKDKSYGFRIVLIHK